MKDTDIIPREIGSIAFALRALVDTLDESGAIKRDDYLKKLSSFIDTVKVKNNAASPHVIADITTIIEVVGGNYSRKSIRSSPVLKLIDNDE